ncbi:hypothetical protein HYT26_01405 [Candidatus Pacearchaeota archaeon]|nr:hypothetical protein [Candidatus Pacearchaeota archaeon]
MANKREEKKKMEQEIADSIGVIEAKRKEQKDNRPVAHRIFSGIRMVPERDRFGEFTGCEAVKVYRD